MNMGHVTIGASRTLLAAASMPPTTSASNENQPPPLLLPAASASLSTASRPATPCRVKPSRPGSGAAGSAVACAALADDDSSIVGEPKSSHSVAPGRHRLSLTMPTIRRVVAAGPDGAHSHVTSSVHDAGGGGGGGGGVGGGGLGGEGGDG